VVLHTRRFGQLFVGQVLAEQALLVVMIEERYNAALYAARLEGEAADPQARAVLKTIDGSAMLPGSVIFFAEQDDDPDDLLLPGPVRSALQRSLEYGRNYVWFHNGIERILAVNETLVFEGTPYALTLFRPWDGIDRVMRRLTVSLLVVVGAAIALTVVSVLVMSRSILRPVALIGDHARRLAADDYGTRMPAPGVRELDPLVSQFNAMAERIEADVSALREQSEERRRFAENLTHEIGTPLTAIKGMGMLLERQSFDGEKVRQMAASIVRSAERLERLQKSLYALARINGASIRVTEFAASELRELLSADLWPETDRRGEEPFWIIEAVTLVGDRDLIATATGNLVANAARFATSPGKVTVTVERSGHTQRIRVTDDGPGIPPDDLSRATEPFVRLQATTEPNSLGLGLALCTGIAKAHGGTLRLANLDPHGLSAEIAWPARR
jgi:two-component system, OmpR family, sensor kinase